jgi:hypothetical protein
MKSFSTLRNLYGSLTNDAGTTNLALGDQIINDEIQSICAMKDWPFLERSRNITTVASQQFYPLPYDCDIVREVHVTVSSKIYVPKLCPNRETWDRLNSSSFTSNIPEYYFVFAGQVGIWPKPATAGNTITIIQKTKPVDLSIADLTTSTIASIASGAKAMIVSAGLTAQMVGFWIKPTLSSTANTGDGRWYEIASVTDSTHLTLVKEYGGNSIAAATAACVIGQMPLLPGAFHKTPVNLAAAKYWGLQGDARAAFYQNQYDRDIKTLVASSSAPTSNMVIDYGDDEEIINPNLKISL